MKQKIFSPGILNKERDDNLKPEKKGGTKRAAKSQKYKMYETMTPKERATKWFERPAYSIRGDTNGYSEDRKREEEGVSQKLSEARKKNLAY